MAEGEDEEKLLRSAALQNANRVLLARKRAEAALARKSEELAHSISMMRATLESTTDAILVTDNQGIVTDFNAKFLQIWRLPPEVVATRQHHVWLDAIAPQLGDPAGFRAAIKEILTVEPKESFHLLETADGRVLERHTKIQRIGERLVGRVWSLRDITDRRRAEEELQRQREWFRVTLASIGDAVITTDTESRITFLNTIAEKMTGWTNEEANGQPLEIVFNIVNEQTRRLASNPVSRVLREGVIVGIANHTALIARDGTERAIEDSAAPIRDASGAIAGVVMVFHDVTDRRRAEKLTEQSERMLSDFFENAVIGLHLVGPDGRILRANRAELKLLGYSVEEFVGHSVAEFHVDQPAIEEILRRLASRDAPDEFEARLRCKDGTIKDVLVSSNVYWEDGKFVHTRFFTRDITEQKRAELARAHLAALVESSDDAIVSKTLKGIVQTWNKGAERMFGYNAEEMIGQPVMKLVPTDRAQEEYDILERLRRGEHIEHYETVRQRKNGTKLDVSLTVSPIRDARGKIIGASKIARDVTDRKQAETASRAHESRIHQAEQQARDAAERANRSKDDFLATLSHELRTPLTPVLAILSTVGEEHTLSAALAADLEMVRRNIELEMRLIDDLLDLTRVTRGKLELHVESVALDRLIENAVVTCAAELKAKALTLRRDIQQPAQLLEVDSARITQVLWNLLKNAVKFTPPGGTITMRSSVAAGHAMISVADTGMGIEAEKLTRIFDAFEQGGRKITQEFGGLGLGLAISKAVADAHGGTLSAASEGPGRGSIFTLTVPCESQAEGSFPSKRTQSSKDGVISGVPRVMSARLLLVEDHGDTAFSLVRLLRRDGHEVRHAATVADALRAAEEMVNSSGLDCVVSDLGLPDGNGLDMMRQLSARYHVTGIALSGYGMDLDRLATAAAGFSRHLTKPVDVAALRAAVGELTKRRRPA
jgi:two-component system CheB/CheR fusion protein